MLQLAGLCIIKTLSITFGFIGVGILVEYAFRRLISPKLESPTLRSRLFNCKYDALLVLSKGSVELIYVVLVTFAVVKFSPKLLLFRSHRGVGFALFVSLLYSMLQDFMYYWVHRWQHSRWLWPMHALHHEDEHVNITTAFKFHWLDSIFSRSTQILPALFLPQPLVVIPLISLVGVVRVSYEHLAIPVSLGPFNAVLTSPANHRIHHSKLPEHCDKNFAAVWPFWDVLFGTYCAPKPGKYPPTGVYSGKVTRSLKDAFFGPLVIAGRESKSD